MRYLTTLRIEAIRDILCPVTGRLKGAQWRHLTRYQISVLWTSVSYTVRRVVIENSKRVMATTLKRILRNKIKMF